MKPLAANRLVPWRKQHRACTLEVSRAELEECLGPPLARDPQGFSTGDQWSFQCDCGLEMLIELPRQPDHALQQAVVWMEHLEVEHLLTHLGLGFDRVLWRADTQEPLPLEGWAIVRQDAHGNRFDICVMSDPAHAECMARRLEANAPCGQSYCVEPRGVPVREQEELPRRTWAFHPAETAAYA